MNFKRNERLRIRALEEHEIINKCVAILESRKMEQEKERQVAKSRMEEIKAQATKAQEEHEDEIFLNELAIVYDTTFENYQDLSELVDIFSRTKAGFVELSAKISTLIARGWYKPVIKFVPEKQLPKVLSSSNIKDFQKVIRIIERVVAKIEDYNKKFYIVDKDNREMRKVRSKENQTYKDLRSAGNRFEDSNLFKAIDDKKVVAPTPVSIQAEDTETVKNTNKV